MIRVLIPTDFSDHSYNALSYAHMLFQGEEVEFTLLHAYEASALQLVGNKSPMRIGTIYKALKTKATQDLLALKTEIVSRNEFSNHTYKTLAHEGHLREAISAFTREDYHYIVMGSKGATGLKEIFLGSVTYDIVALHQEIPLLIVPENARFRIPDTIGFATDFAQNYDRKQLQPLIHLTIIWKSTLHMIEVYNEPELDQEQKQHLKHLESLLKEINCRFHVIPKFSSLENCINIFDQELEVDILVLIDYPKTFFQRLMREPVLKKMTFHTTLPFLILPALTTNITL